MPTFKVVLTDHGFSDITPGQNAIEAAGGELQVFHCETESEVIRAACEADALLVQYAPITPGVIAALKRCRVIVRLGIGTDNVNIPAATEQGIPVCNVPDYGIDEVADHTVALALSLARQLSQVDSRLRGGIWKTTPVAAMPAFREMTFATAGFGRIGRAVHERAAAFKFRLAAYDPFVDAATMAAVGVSKLALEELFTQAGILSLHLPLGAETHHLVNAARLRQMKRHAIVVNTARGGLIDTSALIEALNSGVIAGAGLDVFEDEPLPAGHPLFSCRNVLLTSHIAWYSESSMPRLLQLAAGEVVSAVRGDALRNKLN